jgi:hypothetical protein
MRILFDQGTPVPLRPLLVGHGVRTRMIDSNGTNRQRTRPFVTRLAAPLRRTDE